MTVNIISVRMEHNTWQDPPPFFLNIDIFFHVNNILLDSVIHRELQNVVYMKKNIDVQEKGGGGPVHNYLWRWVICIFSSCHKILLNKVENILTDVRWK